MTLLSSFIDLASKSLTSIGGSIGDQSALSTALQGDSLLSGVLLPGSGITGAIIAVSSVINRIFPDKSAEEKYKFLIALQQELDSTKLLDNQHIENLEDDKIAEQSDSLAFKIFYSGWRPTAAWLCVISLAAMTLQNILLLVLYFLGIHLDLPPIDNSFSYSILMGILGLGTMRTVEKYFGDE